MGLKPILQRVYVEGETPIANLNWRFKWLWLYAFVHPKTGETYCWILPYVSTKLFSQVLADFAREFEVGAKKRIILAVDRAGWHISHDARNSGRVTFDRRRKKLLQPTCDRKTSQTTRKVRAKIIVPTSENPAWRDAQVAQTVGCSPTYNRSI